jgi:hypothetical protein
VKFSYNYLLGYSFINSHAFIVQEGPLASLEHTHIQTHGRTPLDECSARCRDLHLHRTTQHINTSDKHPCPERHSNPRDPTNQAATELRIRLRGHWYRHLVGYNTVSLCRSVPSFRSHLSSYIDPTPSCQLLGVHL